MATAQPAKLYGFTEFSLKCWIRWRFATLLYTNCLGRPPETGNTLAITYHVHVPRAHWTSLGLTATATAVAWTVAEVRACSLVYFYFTIDDNLVSRNKRMNIRHSTFVLNLSEHIGQRQLPLVTRSISSVQQRCSWSERGPPFSVALICRTWLVDWAFKGWIPQDTKKTWNNCRPLGVATTPIVRCLVSNAAIHKELVSASRVSLQFPCMKTTKGKSTGYIATFSHVHAYIYIYIYLII